MDSRSLASLAAPFLAAAEAASAASALKASRSSSTGMPSLAISTLPRSCPPASSASATEMIPLTEILRRSFIVAPSAARMTSPSRIRRPTCSLAILAGPFGARRIRSPFSWTRLEGMPSASAKRRCSWRWRASPWTGMTIRGRIQWNMAASSGRPGWPETWTWAWRSVIMITSARASAFWMRPMATSLPGICLEEKTTVSSSSSLIWWLSKAIRARAARSSPWPPVAIIRTSRRGMRIASSNDTVSGKSRR